MFGRILANAFVFSGLAAVIAASPLTESLSTSAKAFAVKDSLNVPHQWKRSGTVSPQHVLTLQIGLKQGSFDELERQLLQVSDPDHEKYGQHLSQKEVAQLVKPSKDTDALVRDWLNSNGVEEHQIHCNHAGDWMKVDLPVHQIERLLNTEYSTFEHEDGTQLVRAPIWSLPLYLHDHIDTIQPTNTFMRPRARRSTAKFQTDHNQAQMVADSVIPFTDNAKSVCDPVLVTPTCLRTYYGTYNYTPKAVLRNKMGVANYLGELNNRSDASIFFERFRPDAIGSAQSFKLISVANGTVQQTPNNQTQLEEQTGVEGALDIQTMLGVAYPIDLISYSTGGRNPDFMPDAFTPTNSDEPYLEWVNYMLSLPQSKLPYVVSTSYADNEQTVGRSYAIAVCRAFAQLGARGVTLLFGSGDEGVGGNGKCLTNDGRNATRFTPEFPSSCPYVTIVGGTYKFAPEVAALDPRFRTPYTSGGGFSDIFPQPEYQRTAVSRYLEANRYFPEYKGLFNISGRAYPDLAAQSQNFSVVWNARTIPVDGTSAATPLMSAIIALVNDALISQGRNPLGFMNPWLYKKGYKAFNDILSGNSAGCNTTGFPAQKGWDAVTGFGTPWFPDILNNLGLNVDFDYPGKPMKAPKKPKHGGDDKDRNDDNDDDNNNDEDDDNDDGDYDDDNDDDDDDGGDDDDDGDYEGEGDEHDDAYYLSWKRYKHRKAKAARARARHHGW